MPRDKQEPILTVTLNPALDLSSSTERVEPNHKLRCSNPTAEPGGGGVNVSRAIAILGGFSDPFVVLGGAVGHQIQSLLVDQGLDPIIAPVSINSRIAMAITDTTRQDQYRFGFPGEALNDGDIAAIRERLSQQLPRAYGLMVLSGSLASGMPEDFYARLIGDFRASDTRVVLDAHGESLRQGISRKPWLIKLDYHESLELFELSTLNENEAITAARTLRERDAADVVIITMRSEGAVVSSPEGDWRIRPPAVTVDSAIGAGDSFIGALCLSTARGEPLIDACRFGVATAAAAVSTPGTRLCERDTAEWCRDRTEVQVL